MKKLVAAVAIAIVAIAGGLYFLLQGKVSNNVEAGVKSFFANLPPEYTKRGYGKVTVDLASQSATIEAIELERNDGRKIKVAKLEIANLDPVAVQAVFDPSAYKAGASDATFKRLFASMTASGVHIEDGGDASDIAKLNIQNLQARQFPAAPTPEWRNGLKRDQIAAIVLRTFKFDSADFEQVLAQGKDGATELKHLQINALNAVNLGRALIEGMRFNNPASSDSAVIDRLEIADLQWEKLLAEQADGKTPADFGATMELIQLGRFEISGLNIKDGKDGTDIVLPKLSFGKLDADGLGSAAFTGLVVRNTKEHTDVTIGEFEIAGLHWGGLIEGMRSGGSGMVAAMSKKRAWVDRMVVRKIGGGSLDNLGLAIGEVNVAAKKLSEDADQSVMRISGIGIDATKSNSADIKQLFQMLDYQRAVFEIVIGGSIDRKAKSFEVDQFTIAAPQVGAFDLKLALDNFVDQTDPAKSLDALMAASLKGFSVSYADAGLVPKLIKVAAQQQGITEEQFRAMILEQVKGMAEAMGDIPAIAAAADSIKAFLASPKTLVLAAAPVNPVPFAAIGGAKDDPPALIELLKLTLVYK